MFKKIIGSLFSLILMLGLSTSAIYADEPVVTWPENLPTTSRDDAPDEVKTNLATAIQEFTLGDTDGMETALAAIQAASPDEWYPIYRMIFDEWQWIETEMPENLDVCPDNLPNPENHCFIVLGYGLTDDGELRQELINRLTVGKNCLDKYPDSKVLVTGGVEKNGWTEGARMKEWLINQGIDESRIFMEDKAPDTAGNATNSFDILYADGNIKSVSVITTQYHLKRGCILYYTESLLKAKELGVAPIEFMGDYTTGWYREDKTVETMSQKALSMYKIVRVVAPECPMLDTDVTDLQIVWDREGGNVFTQGDDLEVCVKTIDTAHLYIPVTDYCTFTGYDSSKVGTQTVTVSFTNKKNADDPGTTTTKDFEVVVVYPEFKEDLAAYVDEVKAMDLSAYLYGSVAPVETALANAQGILDSVDATEDDATTALASLQSAVDGLTLPSADVSILYRYYNPNSGEHFYTNDAFEGSVLEKEGWIKEGSAWSSPSSSSCPVYRLYNPNAGDHHYTTSLNETKALMEAGWNYEGIGWYGSDSKEGAVWRVYNPNAISGAHHFTSDEAEYKALINLGWKAEGIAWYSA